jgi:hypothetical protein
MYRLDVGLAMVLTLGAATLLAQETRLEGPVSGLVFDAQTRSLRWVVGIPGAAYLGSAVADGLEIASVAPNGKLAAGLKDGALALLRIHGESAAWETLEAEAGAVERIAWSADSSAVAVAGAALRIWRNLGSTPEALALEGVEGAGWTAFEVEPGGEAVLAGKAGGVYRLSGGGARLVADVGDPTGIAIAGEVAYIADRAGKQVLAMWNWKASAEVSLVAGESAGIEDPVAVGLGADGRSVLVAGGASRRLLQLDAATGALTQRWDLEFSPTRVERLGSGLFLLTSRGAETEPLQVLAARQASILFIPAGAALSGDAGLQE